MDSTAIEKLTREIEQLLNDLLISENMSDQEKLLLINEVLGVFSSKRAN